MAFTGRAIYDPGVFEGVAEDVSPEISEISPFETPFLDRLGQAERAATSVFHEWLEEKLNPVTVGTSTGIDDTTNPGTLTVHDSGGAAARFIQVGAIFQVETTGEYIEVSAINGDAISFARAFGGTTAATITAGDTLFFIGDAALEGADVVSDISRPRVRVTNFVQIFKKDIIVSGTVQAVRQLGGITNEMDHQRAQRLKEIVRDLEKTVIRGKTSGNSIGSATARRSMRGVLDYIQTNVTTFSAVSSLGPDELTNIIRDPWEAGASDLDLIVCDAAMKQQIDSFNTTRVEVMNLDERFHNRVSVFQSTYGNHAVMLNRWMPANSLMVVSTDRIKVVPLTGRSFQFRQVSRTGDADKAMIVGEYTVEVHNEEGMAQAFV